MNKWTFYFFNVFPIVCYLFSLLLCDIKLFTLVFLLLILLNYLILIFSEKSLQSFQLNYLSYKNKTGMSYIWITGFIFPLCNNFGIINLDNYYFFAFIVSVILSWRINSFLYPPFLILFGYKYYTIEDNSGGDLILITKRKIINNEEKLEVSNIFENVLIEVKRK